MTQALKKHPGGRPTIYNKALLDKTVEYLTNWQDQGHKVPSIAGLAQVLDCDRETIHRWYKDESKTEFSNIINKLLSYQEHALVDNGLDGTYNATITKLMLSKHGYTDSQDKQGVSVNVIIKRGGEEIEVKGQTLTVGKD